MLYRFLTSLARLAVRSGRSKDIEIIVLSGHSASAFAFASAIGKEIPAIGGPLRVLAGAVAYSPRPTSSASVTT